MVEVMNPSVGAQFIVSGQFNGGRDESRPYVPEKKGWKP